MGLARLGAARLAREHAAARDRRVRADLAKVVEVRDAHTESDLVLWSASDRLAVVGGLVDGARLPVLAQGRVLGWLQALDKLQAMQPQWLVGQHLVSGPGQVRSALQVQRDYLCGLVRYAWQALDRGWSEAEAINSLKLPERWAASSAAVSAANPTVSTESFSSAILATASLRMSLLDRKSVV